MRLLHTTAGYGSHKYYVDGRRTTKANYDYLYDQANLAGKLGPDQRAERRNGHWYKYHEVIE